MSDLLTPAELAAIAEREAKATKGPWMLRHDGWTIRDSKGERQIAHTYGRDGSFVEQQVSDAEFIAHARTDIPALLRHIAALEAMAEAASSTQIEAAFKEGYDIACDGSYDWSVQKDNYYKKSEAFRVVAALEARTPAPADDPELDGTDFAHPAWFRGYGQSLAEFCYHVNDILDGKDDGKGENFEGPWRELRKRLVALVKNPAPATDVDALLAEAERHIDILNRGVGDSMFASCINDLATALRESRAREVAALQGKVAALEKEVEMERSTKMHLASGFHPLHAYQHGRGDHLVKPMGGGCVGTWAAEELAALRVALEEAERKYGARGEACRQSVEMLELEQKLNASLREELAGQARVVEDLEAQLKVVKGELGALGPVEWEASSGNGWGHVTESTRARCQGLPGWEFRAIRVVKEAQ